MDITFLLNGETVTLHDAAPTDTLLDFLRGTRALTGTKEGCNEGDCGACTVMVQDEEGAKALNGCILFLPQLDGKAVTTVEGLSGPDGALHPVQEALVTRHGSQCGFCTPGFAMSMATAHLNSDPDCDTYLAGNLCRCTGYAPIRRAAEDAARHPVPDWFGAQPDFDQNPDRKIDNFPSPGGAVAPVSSDELAEMYAKTPDATLVAGATDVGLWVTKQMRQIDPVIFLGRCEDLKSIDIDADRIRIGAMVSVERVLHALAPYHPGLSAMLRRYGSRQVRNAATIGGNIANGSPIGDSPPALIALGASLHLRKGGARRTIPLEDFFLSYGKQDRAPGEFVEAVTIPRQQDTLGCYKISKRFDQDISALLGAFNITVANQTVTAARIAFGGMAGIPQRAAGAEAALIGAPWEDATIQKAMAALDQDFDPLSDMRASRAYRRTTAKNLLMRHYLERTGAPVDILAVTP